MTILSLRKRKLKDPIQVKPVSARKSDFVTLFCEENWAVKFWTFLLNFFSQNIQYDIPQIIKFDVSVVIGTNDETENL